MSGTLAPRELKTPVTGVFYTFRASALTTDPTDALFSRKSRMHPCMAFPNSEESKLPRSRHQPQPRDDFVWFEFCSAKVAKCFTCPVSKQHVTESWHEVTTVDSMSGPRFSAFIPATEDGNYATDAFREQLEKTPFRGMRFTDVEYKVIQGNPPPKATFGLSAKGTNCRIPMEVTDAVNACPFCGHGPLVCTQCAFIMRQCFKCGEETCVSAALRKPDDQKRIGLSESFLMDVCQFDLTKWDGRDFVNCGGEQVVSCRVLDWMTEVHAGPWIAEPWLVELDGLPSERLAQLLEVAGSDASTVKRALNLTV